STCSTRSDARSTRTSAWTRPSSSRTATSSSAEVSASDASRAASGVTSPQKAKLGFTTAGLALASGSLASGSEPPDHVEGTLDVLPHAELRAEGALDDPLAIEDEGRAPGQQPERLLHPVRGGDAAVRVGEEHEGQTVLRAERLVAAAVIGADADDRRSRADELFVGIPKRTRLHGAARRVIPGIEVDHHRSRLPELLQAHLPPRLVRQRELRSPIAHAQSSHAPTIDAALPAS